MRLALLLFTFVCLNRMAFAADGALLPGLVEKAEKGDISAQVTLAEMYRVGDGVPKDSAEAVKWYRKAAEQGDIFAQSKLGGIYGSDDSGVTRDEVEAMKWFRKAADQGDISSQSILGYMYNDGVGGPKNAFEAAKWFRKAALAGNAYAQTNLGSMYEHGRGGITKDEVEAVKWYRKAAEQGDAGGLSCLGGAYWFGTGVIKDLVEAHCWMNISSALGNRYAKIELLGIEREMTREQIAEATKLARERFEKFKKKD